MSKRNKSERLAVVLEIAKMLNKFPTNLLNEYAGDETYINLYHSKYEAIIKVKKEFDFYINQDDTNPKLLTGVSGRIPFLEIEKIIEYVLPIKKNQETHFVFRTTEKNTDVPYTHLNNKQL
jgi:hypothetical protein